MLRPAKKSPTDRAVLVVDDHPELRRMVVRMLGRASIDPIDEAESGEECQIGRAHV